MSLDLHKDTRPDEKFHLQWGKPQIRTHKKYWWGRYISWKNIRRENGQQGSWKSLWIWKLQIYWGNVKCDATRTYMYWNHQLDNTVTDTQRYVMTTTPKEMKAFRWRSQGPKPVTEDVWADMGGI